MKKFIFLLVGAVVLAGCYPINRVRPETIVRSVEQNPGRGIIYLTYSYHNPTGGFIDAIGRYRFLWNYRQPMETYYLLEMENIRGNEMVVYHTAPTVIRPVDFIISNRVVHTIMLRHNFPADQAMYVQAGEVLYLGHIHVGITNIRVGFIPTTGYDLVWEDREEKDRAALYAQFPMLTNWRWRKQIVQMYPAPAATAPAAPLQPQPVQPAHAVPQVVVVTNVVTITNPAPSR